MLRPLRLPMPRRRAAADLARRHPALVLESHSRAPRYGAGHYCSHGGQCTRRASPRTATIAPANVSPLLRHLNNVPVNPDSLIALFSEWTTVFAECPGEPPIEHHTRRRGRPTASQSIATRIRLRALLWLVCRHRLPPGVMASHSDESIVLSEAAFYAAALTPLQYVDNHIGFSMARFRQALRDLGK